MTIICNTFASMYTEFCRMPQEIIVYFCSKHMASYLQYRLFMKGKPGTYGFPMDNTKNKKKKKFKISFVQELKLWNRLKGWNKSNSTFFPFSDTLKKKPVVVQFKKISSVKELEYPKIIDLEKNATQ